MTNERLPSLDCCILYSIRSTMSSVPTQQWMMSVLIKAKRKINARKTKLQAELDEIAQRYGLSASDLRV